MSSGDSQTNSQQIIWQSIPFEGSISSTNHDRLLSCHLPPKPRLKSNVFYFSGLRTSALLSSGAFVPRSVVKDSGWITRRLKITGVSKRNSFLRQRVGLRREDGGNFVNFWVALSLTLVMLDQDMWVRWLWLQAALGFPSPGACLKLQPPRTSPCVILGAFGVQKEGEGRQTIGGVFQAWWLTRGASVLILAPESKSQAFGWWLTSTILNINALV